MNDQKPHTVGHDSSCALMRIMPGKLLLVLVALSELFIAGYVLCGLGAGSLIGIESDAALDLASIALLVGMLIAGGMLLWMTRHWITDYASGKNESYDVGTRDKIVPIMIAFLSFPNGLYSQDLHFQPVYTTQGYMVVYEYELDGSTSPPYAYYYEVAKGDHGKWRSYCIKSDDNEHPIHGRFGEYYHHLSYDGTNIYSTITWSKIITPDGPVEMNENEAMLHNQEVGMERGPIPVYYSYGDFLRIWFMYMGGDCIKSHPKIRIPDITRHVSSNIVAWSCDFDYEWYPNTDILKKGVFRVNQSLLSKDFSDYPNMDIPTSDDVRLSQYELVDTYAAMTNSSALIRSEFTVNDIILTNDIAIPGDMEIYSYGWNREDRQSNRLYCRYYLSTTNVVWHDHEYKLELLPEIASTNVEVLDRRFRFRDEKYYLDDHRYSITNKVWTVSSNDPRILAVFEKYGNFRQSIYGSETSHNMYYTVAVLCIIALLVPFCFIIIKQNRRRNVEGPDD